MPPYARPAGRIGLGRGRVARHVSTGHVRFIGFGGTLATLAASVSRARKSPAWCGRGSWMSAGGDGGESNSPSRTRSPRTSYRYFRPTWGFAIARPPTGGVSDRLSGVPLGSLTPLTGVGDVAPPLMTSSPSGEGGRSRCSLSKQREQLDDCQLLACPRFYEAMRATSTCSSRSLSPVET